MGRKQRRKGRSGDLSVPICAILWDLTPWPRLHMRRGDSWHRPDAWVTDRPGTWVPHPSVAVRYRGQAGPPVVLRVLCRRGVQVVDQRDVHPVQAKAFKALLEGPEHTVTAEVEDRLKRGRGWPVVVDRPRLRRDEEASDLGRKHELVPGHRGQGQPATRLA